MPSWTLLPDAMIARFLGRSAVLVATLAAISATPAPAFADDARLHTFHCVEACPLGAPENAVLRDDQGEKARQSR